MPLYFASHLEGAVCAECGVGLRHISLRYADCGECTYHKCSELPRTFSSDWQRQGLNISAVPVSFKGRRHAVGGFE